MSTLLEPVVDIEPAISSLDSEFTPKLFNNNKNWKSKENIFKPKCRKELKKKLKKYKLRRDGQEDPEVLDVSQILVSALKIKSPNNLVSNGINNSEEDLLRPKNYLFKMGRKKLAVKKKIVADDGDAMVGNDVKSKKDHRTIDISEVNNVESPDVSKISLIQNDISLLNGELTKSKDKKQANAFTIMMDSRNKSIGSNSPGKDKVMDESDQQSLIEKKNIKAKRNLLLQKMAEAKGSLKNKEMEELQEKCIKIKMEKRAERLKNLIKNNESKSAGKIDKINSPDKEVTPQTVSTNNNDLPLLSHKNKLKLVNIFSDPLKSQNMPIKKKESFVKEDDEFLKKLSPSLKKKENMLSYFKKVEKEQDDAFDCNEVEDNTIIKVKLKSKGKNKIKKKKLSLNKAPFNEDLQNENDHENNTLNVEPKSVQETKIKKKIKCSKSIEKEHFPYTQDSAKAPEFDPMRPRRNVKRPAKYIDDVLLSSSDDELHIFTPKKKKHAEPQKTCVPEAKAGVNVGEPKIIYKSTKKTEHPTTTSKGVTKETKQIVQPKKPTKLAPIFAAKPQLDAAALEAKQKFLSSGVPDKLKKIIEKQIDKNTSENSFHTVVHVQQKEIASTNTMVKLGSVISICESDAEIGEVECKKDFFKSILTLTQRQYKGELKSNVGRTKTQAMLQSLKQLYPKFPVYRTYRLLRDKKKGEFKDCSYLDLDNSIEVVNGMVDINNESPDKLSWTEKYKGMSSKQIIGNFECIKELKKWLISWTENDDKVKKNNNAGSDSSDFYLSDTDSKDSMKSTNNLMVLTGPVGSGKTSLVYAVAAELSIKVLEVNASSRRTGKIMLQDLQEATQSHKVNRCKSSQDNSQKIQETNCSENLKVTKKRGRPKKSEVLTKKSEKKIKNEVLSQAGSQDNVRTCMSLILIDDADIVFEQDDGFCSAIVQLVQCSKRPVILITSTKSCPHLQRFLQCAKIIHTQPLLPRILGTWLDIMCLADSGSCWPGLGAKCLDYFNGDIRRTINFLQFQTAKDSQMDDTSSSQNVDDCKIAIEDENSNMSWSERESASEGDENNRANMIDESISKYFMYDQFSFEYTINVFKLWWNIPRLLIAPIESISHEKNKKTKKGKAESEKILELDVISKVADMISFVDCFSYSKNDKESQILSVPWMNYECNSVSEQENSDTYDRNYEIRDEISHYLLSGSIRKSQSDLHLESVIDLQFPDMTQRREKERIISRHSSLTSFLNPSTVLDRRALALDYWSGCRTICRVERTRTDCNLKRNNRFCHYLKSVNILCKSDSLDKLVNSLSSKEENKVE